MNFNAILRRLLAALIVCGLISGSAAFASPMTMDSVGIGKAQSQVAEMPCGMSMMQSTGAPEGKMPCNKMTPDCVNQLVCAQVSVLPERFVVSQDAFASTSVTYWSSYTLLEGLTVEPDISPPVAI